MNNIIIATIFFISTGQGIMMIDNSSINMIYSDAPIQCQKDDDCPDDMYCHELGYCEGYPDTYEDC